MRLCLQVRNVNQDTTLKLDFLGPLAAFMLLPLAAVAEQFLYMAEEDGCFWCARWNKEISAAYPKTPEGQAAPLRRFDIHADHPQGVTFAARVRFTPTFILVKDGQEMNRIEGYPGEDFFWGLLGTMLESADVPLNDEGCCG